MEVDESNSNFIKLANCFRIPTLHESLFLGVCIANMSLLFEQKFANLK